MHAKIMFVFKPESFDAQTNRAVFQWSPSVFRELYPQIAYHHLSTLDWIGNIILTLKIFSSLLSSLSFSLELNAVSVCHYFHLCLPVHSSSELKNNLLAHRVKISIPLKVHVCLSKTQCHFQKVCVIHWGYYVHSILPSISLTGRNMPFFWSRGRNWWSGPENPSHTDLHSLVRDPGDVVEVVDLRRQGFAAVCTGSCSDSLLRCLVSSGAMTDERRFKLLSKFTCEKTGSDLNQVPFVSLN